MYQIPMMLAKNLKDGATAAFRDNSRIAARALDFAAEIGDPGATGTDQAGE